MFLSCSPFSVLINELKAQIFFFFNTRIGRRCKEVKAMEGLRTEGQNENEWEEAKRGGKWAI